ncbi:hypothetical protein [Commensalibacter oyaizuii]|uniref:Lipoprotein n=1 Tax=Commensalibacter oyaizuii TaxID=3043873 RepID=A0ABT6Q2Y3_9PROT|nr:hypothetical protein [Commensalibacter sp. TBRC 16381]MDI2090926.1 hypothetical protein [Commensalibacter sp. TBRC 16381]
MSFSSKFTISSAFILLSSLTGCGNQQAPVTASSQNNIQNTATAPYQTNAGGSNSKTTSEKLGTKWGENIASSVTTRQATRETNTPTSMASIYYSTNPDRSYPTSYIALDKILMQVQDPYKRKMKLYPNGNNNYTLQGKEGQRYQLYFYNNSPEQSYEVVTTVDGIDVVSGQTGSVRRRGYIISPQTSLTIAGFRKSQSDVAAFRFSKPEHSYAAHSVAGDISNTGVIGVAVFPLLPQTPPKCAQQAFPQDSEYAPPPCQK